MYSKSNSGIQWSHPCLAQSGSTKIFVLTNYCIPSMFLPYVSSHHGENIVNLKLFFLLPLSLTCFKNKSCTLGLLEKSLLAYLLRTRRAKYTGRAAARFSCPLLEGVGDRRARKNGFPQAVPI